MDQEHLQHFRHSLAHLLAAAVMELWPDTKRTIGPAIENGFYFDFEFSKPISDADLATIEAKMREIMPAWHSFDRHELTPEAAKKEYPDNPYKHELIDEFAGQGQTLTFYKSGAYWDLCRGGHSEGIASMDPQCFKLTKLAGSYWRGNEKNAQLTRIYGVAFATKKELDAYLKMMEEAEKRDHKKLGKEFGLFTFSELVGSGLPLWTPKGTMLRTLLDEFVWSLRKEKGYQRVTIPHITKKDLYIKSGHWAKFSDELFKINTREGHEFAMKPMNCPHHTQIFDCEPRSYRDMPQRYAETTMVYRDEQSGELAGLSRVRAITQDDAHVFCRKGQIEQEVLAIWDIIDRFYSAFGFDLSIRLSMHDPEKFEKYLGTPEVWKQAEDQLRAVIVNRGKQFVEGVGEAAMYGPKIDFMGTDAIGRKHQVATIQLDFNQPEGFNLNCINEQGEKERIVMIHCAIMGSIERFLSVLIEHFAAAFPLWLSPVQIAILPVADRHIDFARALAKEFEAQGLRPAVDDSPESVGKKIRQSEKQKMPLMLVVGDKEIESGSFMVRRRGSQDQVAFEKQALIQMILEEVQTKKLG
jgi:threonyl-tRNA synthetase